MNLVLHQQALWPHDEFLSIYMCFLFSFIFLQQILFHMRRKGEKKYHRMKWNWKCWKRFSFSIIHWFQFIFFCEYKKYSTINTFGVSSIDKKSEKKLWEKKKKFRHFHRPLVENEEESALVKLNSTSEHSVKGLPRLGKVKGKNISFPSCTILISYDKRATSSLKF